MKMSLIYLLCSVSFTFLFCKDPSVIKESDNASQTEIVVENSEQQAASHEPKETLASDVMEEEDKEMTHQTSVKSSSTINTPNQEVSKKESSKLDPAPVTHEVVKDELEKVDKESKIEDSSQAIIEDVTLELEDSTHANNESVESIFALHDSWDKLLRKNVSNAGAVDYKGFIRDKAEFNAYLEQLSAATPEKSDRSASAMAFWINAYNAFTVKLIIDNYPINSIRDLSNGNPWDDKWIDLGGEKHSLNQIEHDIIRPFWKDARIHFAVNCAAKSCPPLANKAFTSDNLNKLLEDLTRSFVNNPRYNQITRSKLSLSKIFEWYKSDFGDLNEYIRKYSDQSVDSKAKITYLEYNWQLNGK